MMLWAGIESLFLPLCCRQTGRKSRRLLTGIKHQPTSSEDKTGDHDHVCYV